MNTQKHADAVAALWLLVEKFRQAFFILESRRRPLKIGIDVHIITSMNGAIKPNDLTAALRFYVYSPGYLAHACRSHADRFDWRAGRHGDGGSCTQSGRGTGEQTVVGRRTAQGAQGCGATGMRQVGNADAVRTTAASDVGRSSATRTGAQGGGAMTNNGKGLHFKAKSSRWTPDLGAVDERARAAYLKERDKRGREIDWKELPLIPSLKPSKRP